MDGATIAQILCTIITVSGTVAVAYITYGNRRKQSVDQEELVARLRELTTSMQQTRDEVKVITKVVVANSRGLIAQIYEDNKVKKSIDGEVWQNVSDLYDAYKSTKIDGHTPNSWCDALVEEMKHWKKV